MSPEQLFSHPSRDFLTLMAGLPKHLDAAMPMRKQHRRELPGDIRHLSHLLTDERDDLRRDYLADPAALSAYMRYFMPWNLYRLGVLFSGLALDPGGDNPEAETTIIDLGTGPITAPLALWMSRPRLRKRKLHFICVDRAPKPMRLGLDTLTHMAAVQGGLAPWRVTLVKAPLDARLREKADLVIMANALNEVMDRSEGELLENAEALAEHLRSMMTPNGALLVVEPGVRPSAHLIAALRRGLLHRGLNPLSPCPHTGPCPMSGRGYTAWCHFNFEADSAPGWLKKLSEDARLTKDNVSLSFLHFSARGRKLEAPEGTSFVRAVSGPFELPVNELASEGRVDRRFGQYACSDRGLTLLSVPRKHLVPMPGTLLEAAWPEEPAKDVKSGALVLPLGHIDGLQTRPEAEGNAPAKPKAEPKEKPARKPALLPSQRPLKTPGKPSAKPAGKSTASRSTKPAGPNPSKSASPGADKSGAPKASGKPTAPKAGAPKKRTQKSGTAPAKPKGGKGRADR